MVVGPRLDCPPILFFASAKMLKNIKSFFLVKLKKGQVFVWSPPFPSFSPLPATQREEKLREEMGRLKADQSMECTCRKDEQHTPETEYTTWKTIKYYQYNL